MSAANVGGAAAPAPFEPALEPPPPPPPPPPVENAAPEAPPQSAEARWGDQVFGGDVLRSKLWGETPDEGAGVAPDGTAPATETGEVEGPPPAPTFDELKEKAARGELTADDLKKANLRDQDVAELVKGMATADDTRPRANLKELMKSPDFAPHLARALTGMKSSGDALEVFRAVGGNQKSSDAPKIQGTLNKALDEMGDLDPGRRTEILRDAMADPNATTAGPAQRYLAQNDELAADFLQDVCKDNAVDAPKLDQIVERMGDEKSTSLTNALREISGRDEKETWAVFQRLGEASLAVEGKEGPQIRESFEKALNQMPTDERAELLWKAMDDKQGTEPSDKQPNAGHKFIGEYLTRVEGGAEEIERMIETLEPDPADPDDDPQGDFRWFIRNNVTGQHNNDIKRLGDDSLDDPPLTDPGEVDEALLEEARDSITVWGKREEIEKMNGATLEKYIEELKLVPAPASTQPWINEGEIEAVAKRLAEVGTPEARAKFISKIAGQGPMDLDMNKDTQVRLMLTALGDNPNEVVREMDQGALQDMVKMFMVTDPPTMGALKDALTYRNEDGDLVSSLSAENAARIAKAVQAAASPAVSFLEQGSWTGDVLKGLSIEGGFESKKGGSVKVGFSPGALVDGERGRDATRAGEAIGKFLDEYFEVLDGMSQDEKQILKEQLQPKNPSARD